MPNRYATAPVAMCDHLLTGKGLNQPFALLAHPTPLYGCPNCLADAVDGQLREGVPPANVAASLHFGDCGHVDGHKPCWPCREAIAAELLTRRWKAYREDTTHGNRIERVISKTGAKVRHLLERIPERSLARAERIKIEREARYAAKREADRIRRDGARAEKRLLSKFRDPDVLALLPSEPEPIKARVRVLKGGVWQWSQPHVPETRALSRPAHSGVFISLAPGGAR